MNGKKVGDIFLFFVMISSALSISSLYYKHIVTEDYEIFVEYDDEGNLINIEHYNDEEDSQEDNPAENI